MKPQLKSLNVYSAGLSEEALKRKTGFTGTFARLASNENPFGPSPKVKERLSQSLDGLNYYPDPEAVELKDALAKFYDILPEQILVGSGLDEVIMMISRAVLIPEGEVLTSEGSFVQYNTHALIENNEVVMTPLNAGAFDLNAMAEKISDKTALIWICNPNNPTSTYVNETEIRAFLDKVPDNVTVVLDEAYFEFIDKEDCPDGLELQKDYPNIVVLRTFSKAYGLAGVRVGYAITSKETIEEWNKVKLPFNVTSLSLAAAMEALNDQTYLKQYIETNREEREKFLTAPYKAHLLESQTNFIFVKTDEPERLNELLLKNGVIARPMSIGVRITIGTPEQNMKVDEALREFFNV